MIDEREILLQKIKDFFHDTVPYFIDFAVGIGMSLVVTLLLSIPFAFIRDLNMGLIRFVIGLPSICLVLYRRCYRMYYHKNSHTYAFSLKRSAVHIAFAFLWQACFVILVGAHAVYITGPTYWITDTLFSAAARSDMGGHFLREGHDWLLMILADFLFYAPCMLFGEYMGGKERRNDCNEKE